MEALTGEEKNVKLGLVYHSTLSLVLNKGVIPHFKEGTLKHACVDFTAHEVQKQKNPDMN